MSVTSAMYTGVTGLLANANGMNVIGNNLANVNTIGFKSGRILFSDMLSTGVTNSYSASQIGRGTQIQKIDNMFTQSSFQSTEVVSDLAITGNSFFALKAPTDSAPVNQSSAYLTKAGAFRLDSNLFLTNADGYQVLDTEGNPIKFSDNTTNIITAATAYSGGTLITDTVSALQTELATLATKIQAMAPAGSPTVAQSTANNLLQAAQTALGIDSTDLAGAVVTPASTTTGAIVKNAALVNSPTGASAKDAHTALASAYAAFLSASAAAAFTPDGTSAAAITLEQGDPTTQTSGFASVDKQMGLAFGSISKIDNNGLITYTGQDGLSTFFYNSSGGTGIPNTAANALTAQRLALITPSDSSALEKIGGSLFKSTQKAGVPTAAFSAVSNSANGTSNKISSNSLEQSNVDMAAQMVDMIVTQRAYSANSKTITTSDQMTQDVLNLVR